MASSDGGMMVNLHQIFNLIDKNEKGIVNADKIGDMLRYAGLNPTVKDCTQIIGKILN
jgi:Ca2+-binding EF-hand superfamily protein